jgi:hypothetical protein
MKMVEEGIGKRIWAFAAGHIPLNSTGHEPMFTSHDKIAVLNTSVRETQIAIRIVYSDQPPVEYKLLSVNAKRVRKIRFNDLINPLPVPLDTSFGFIITSTEPVIVQVSRINTSSSSVAGFFVTPYAKPVLLL